MQFERFSKAELLEARLKRDLLVLFNKEEFTVSNYLIEKGNSEDNLEPLLNLGLFYKAAKQYLEGKAYNSISSRVEIDGQKPQSYTIVDLLGGAVISDKEENRAKSNAALFKAEIERVLKNLRRSDLKDAEPEIREALEEYKAASVTGIAPREAINFAPYFEILEDINTTAKALVEAKAKELPDRKR